MEPEPTRGGTITDLAPQARDPERVNVYLDGAFAFGLPRDLAMTEGLAIGDVLDESRVAALLAADEAARATSASLAFLAYRPRSEREVRDRLRQKGYGPEAIEAAIARLIDWRYLNDADFARLWVENRATHQPRGQRRLEQELRHKGIDREVVREAIAAAELDEEAAALELARAKLGAYAKLEPVVARRRLGGFLARRGYGFEVIRPVLDRLLGEAAEDEEVDSDRSVQDREGGGQLRGQAFLVGAQLRQPRAGVLVGAERLGAHHRGARGRHRLRLGLGDLAAAAIAEPVSLRRAEGAQHQHRLDGPSATARTR